MDSTISQAVRAHVDLVTLTTRIPRWITASVTWIAAVLCWGAIWTFLILGYVVAPFWMARTVRRKNAEWQKQKIDRLYGRN